jgi:hypothetical protein
MATASGAEGFKQSRGYFVALANIPFGQQFNLTVAPSGAGGSWNSGTMAAFTTGATSTIAANSLLKDMGKTVVKTPADAAAPRVYRKVQLVHGTGPSVTATTPATGMPFYIELVTGQVSQSLAAPVAYMPGLM